MTIVHPLRTRIYVLQHPLNHEVRYVGKTSYPLAFRLRNHIKDSRGGASFDRYVMRWIRKLALNGLSPVIKEIELVDGDGAAQEIAWISKYRQEGARLTNLTNGGDGVVGYQLDLLARAKLSASGKKRWQDPEYQERRGVALRAAKDTPEFRAKSAAAMRRAWNRPGIREKISAAIAASHADPDFRAKQAEDARRAWQDPEKRKRILDARHDPVNKAKRSAGCKLRFANPEERAIVTLRKMGLAPTAGNLAVATEYIKRCTELRKTVSRSTAQKRLRYLLDPLEPIVTRGQP